MQLRTKGRPKDFVGGALNEGGWLHASREFQDIQRQLYIVSSGTQNSHCERNEKPHFAILQGAKIRRWFAAGLLPNVNGKNGLWQLPSCSLYVGLNSEAFEFILQRFNSTITSLNINSSTTTL